MSTNFEQLLENAAKPNLSKRSLLKHLQKIVKAFSDYASQTQNNEKLPPQTFIPFCLFKIPEMLYTLLDLKEGETLKEEPSNLGLRLVTEMYLKAMLRLAEESSNEIKHVIVQAMRKSIGLCSEKIAKKWLKQLIHLWAHEKQNINLSLRCFLVIKESLTHSSSDFFTWALRRIYVTYFENTKQVSYRNLQHINFMINCFCEILKINEQKSYYVLFGYVRSLALEVEKLNKLKRKEKVAQVSKLYSTQIINAFKLLVASVSRFQSEELSALIYPLTEMLSIYQKISDGIEYLPLKLQILELFLVMMESTHVFIPQALDLLKKIFIKPVFQKKVSKQSKVQGDINLCIRMPKQDLLNSNFLNDLFQKTIYFAYWFANIMKNHVVAREVLLLLAKFIKGMQISFSGYKQLSKGLSLALEEDCEVLLKSRIEKHMRIIDESLISKLEKECSNDKLNLQVSAKFKELKEEYADILQKHLIAENEDNQNSNEEQQVKEDHQEIDSGWEEASEGASDFQEDSKDKMASDSESQEMEDENYEGDPDNPDQAAEQWSEHEWSSQNEDQD